MADVWISRKRWTCKYCDVTINDDLPSRRHHESGLRHKQNVEKALQDLYRKGEQERKDAEHTRKEMERIEALAAESYARDQAAAGSSSSSAAAVASPSKPIAAAPKPRSDPPSSHRSHTRPIRKPAEESAQPVAEAGAWEQVEPVQTTPVGFPATASTTAETSDRERARSFKMKEKKARQDDSDDDLDVSTIKIKKSLRTDDVNTSEEKYAVPSDIKREQTSTAHDAVKRDAEGASATSDASTPTAVKKEQDEGSGSATPLKEEGGGGGLFKKRRAGAGAGAKRVRAII